MAETTLIIIAVALVAGLGIGALVVLLLRPRGIAVDRGADPVARARALPACMDA